VQQIASAVLLLVAGYVSAAAMRDTFSLLAVPSSFLCARHLLVLRRDPLRAFLLSAKSIRQRALLAPGYVSAMTLIERRGVAQESDCSSRWPQIAPAMLRIRQDEVLQMLEINSVDATIDAIGCRAVDAVNFFVHRFRFLERSGDLRSARPVGGGKLFLRGFDPCFYFVSIAAKLSIAADRSAADILC
jgi:hypothetical protein